MGGSHGDLFLIEIQGCFGFGNIFLISYPSFFLSPGRRNSEISQPTHRNEDMVLDEEKLF
jgi:hypothetical protein